MQRYNPKDIEPKWQQIWRETGIYTANLASDKPKYIGMSMFNYPSGDGIHVGHAMNYTISDVKARFKRQQGYESYHPVGWDSFGLPAENYAIKAGVSPQQSMATIIPNYHKQYQAMGWSNDWEKEITTSLPEYYKWTQWIFIKMHEHGLAYQDSRWQWWCTKCQTVLANEQVIDGKCWRHDGKDDLQVEKKEVKQWFFRITDYADELLEATDDLNWTESVKLAQKNWIGRSQGAEIDFKIRDTKEHITVFTTRPDTLFGATFMVLAPDHELVKTITTPDNQESVTNYVKETAKKTEVERQAAKEKTGVFTGAYAVNPVNNQEIPVYIADYVLAGYGTGAIMAVPAHDERDYAFAHTYNLPIIPVFLPNTNNCVSYIMGQKNITAADIQALGGEVHSVTDAGFLCVEFPKTSVGAFEQLVTEKMEPGFWNEYIGDEVVFIFKQKDGSTQRYVLSEDTHETIRREGQKFNDQPNKQESVWGWLGGNSYYGDFFLEHKEGTIVNSAHYNGISTAQAREDVVADLVKQHTAISKVNYRMRDWSISRQRYWGAPIPVVNCPKCGPVVLGEEQLPVVLPELTDFKPSGDGRSALARAKDWLKTTCPTCNGPAERETDTMDTYVDSAWYMLRYFDPHNQEKAFSSQIIDKWMPVDFYNGADHATAHLLYARFITRFFNKIGLTTRTEPFRQMLYNGKVTAKDGSPFSKSKGNGPDPLNIIDQGYGADALRMYLMFAAPLELGARWDEQGVPGTYRFLSRIWNLVQELTDADAVLSSVEAKTILPIVHRAAKKVTEDIEENRYNTAIAATMEAVNKLYLVKAKTPVAKSPQWQEALEYIVMLIAPFAPHIADELWQQLGHSDSVHTDHWPQWQDEYLVDDMITIVVQVNGKVRAQLQLPADITEEKAIEAAKADPHVQTFLGGKEIRKKIYVPRKLVNIVV